MSLTVTVLIPAHDEAATIERCIHAARTSSYPVERIVVVADACSDNTAELARSAGADLVLETDFKDKAAAQNAALWDITSDITIGFDGDTWPDPDCIRLMMEHIERDGLDATCSTILPAQGAVVPYSKTTGWGRAEAAFFTRQRRFAYALGRRWWRLCQAKVGRIQVLTGACYAFKTAAIQGIGGFPNGLITADMDATWALHGAGYKLDYTGDALAYTLDPEDFRTYRNQMRRWSSGYYQNMAKHRRQLKNWRSLLVVGGAIFDLVSLFFAEGYLIWSAVTGTHEALLKAFLFWTAVHTIVSSVLVATVVGVREAVYGVVPYTLVNYYNKWLYLCGFTREWILGRHYASWTGRQGRKTVITPMTAARRRTLSILAAATGSLTGLLGGYLGNSLLYTAGMGAAVAIPLSMVRLRGTGKRRATDTTTPAVTEEIPLLKLYDPDTEQTLQLQLPAR
ncbi:glycosyltransferase family 2 protein [Streptomyces sp. NPDC005799]|uniref:glycosyltransferase n=1 Tax=Streptomyces sp. NPDC005799 TaxID=3154678 RepID=UPI0033DB915A